MTTNPNETYTSLEAAYSHFNRELFGGTLPMCLITLQRSRKARGYFARGRFGDMGDEAGVVDEIAMNPLHFSTRTAVETLSTLVHEMVHVWQFHFGRPSRNGYHNRNWGEKMKEVGLFPSDTGLPGGRETGQRVSHYIVEGGPYDRIAAAYLAESGAILFADRWGVNRGSSKTKFTCPECRQNAWGRPDIKLICGNCRTPMARS